MRVCLTGSVSLSAEEFTLEGSGLGSRQARLVLAALVIERRHAVPREQLAEILWPGGLPQSWDPALRGVISKVRANLAAAGLPASEALAFAFGCYQIHLPPDAVVDTELAAAAVEAAEESLRQGDARKACDEAMAARAVLSLPFLPGEDGGFVNRVRDGLRSQLIRALETLSEAHARSGSTALAVEAAEAAIVLEPLRESTHRRLMAAHSAGGNRGAALVAYKRCRRLLAEELGVDPSPSTESAYIELLGDEPSAAPTTSPLGPKEASPFPNGLRRTSPFVGRTEELAQLDEAWREARAGRHRVVLVGGEAGMGKTSLAAQFATAAHLDDAVVLFGRSDEHLLVPCEALAEALSRYIAGCPVERLSRHLESAGPELALLVPELTHRLSSLPQVEFADSETNRHRLFAAVSSFLTAMAQEAPVVLVVEDLQWAGTASLLLLRYLARSLESAAVLIVLTYRDDEVASNPVAVETIRHLRREPGVGHIILPGLDEAAVAAVVTELDGADPHLEPTKLARLLRDETGGNPFYIGELLRHLRESGTSLTVEGGPGDHLSVLGLGIPSSVTEVIIGRSSPLSETATMALSVAAVAGREFELSVLERVGGLEPDPLLRAMDELVGARLVHEVPGVIGSYQFAHGIVREVFYQALSHTRRARLHTHLGEALEALHGARESRLPELAHHYQMAGPAADPEKVIDFSIRAGEQALGRLAYERAATHFERALRASGDRPGRELRRCQVLMALATALRKSGKVGQAREAFLGAADLARRLKDPEALATAALGLAGVAGAVSVWIADDVRICLLEEALEALGETGGELGAKVSADLAKALHLSDQDRRRDDLAREAVESARRIGSPSALIGALSASRTVIAGPANTELRMAFAEEMVEVAERAGDPELSVRARLGSLEDLFEFGCRTRADMEIDAALRLATDLHEPYYLWRGVSWDGLRAIVDGRFDEADRRRQEGLALWQGEPLPGAAQCAEMQLATLRVLNQRPQDAEPGVRAIADAYDTIPSARCFLAFVLAEIGRVSEAAAQFELFAADGFVSPPFDANLLFGVSALAETCAILGDVTRAEMLLELLEPFSGRMVIFDAFGGGAAFGGSVSHHLGLLAETMGSFEEAAVWFARAIDDNTRFGAHPWAERSRLALGRVQAREAV
ncbi:AAA family ATPase [soil metagenome]